MKIDDGNNIKKSLTMELKRIWDNKDFVCGVISIAGYKENWQELLNYIRMVEADGEIVSTDDLQLLAIALRREYDDKKDKTVLKRKVAAAIL